MKQIYNPYLPLNEYVPDGEPHVFGDRVYIYGSHDIAGGTFYCEDDYVVWSAPVDDLKNWKREGISYRRDQDPSNPDGKLQLWAPDVTRGPDGRYYLYYCLAFHLEIGVAVSENPVGPFQFLGHVHYPSHMNEGKVLQEYMPFDPAVLTDYDGRVFLYYGFAPAKEKALPDDDSVEEYDKLSEEKKKRIDRRRRFKAGQNSMVAELEPDMVTLKEEPHPLIPGGNHTEGTGFEGHGFFEASSIRRFGEKYYFVYSSHKSHELCYAVSDRPDQGFVYGGTVISNGDIGLYDRTKPVYALGNNHGGIEKIGEEYYVFYHRQTNGTEFSRQGCAEKIEILPDGSIEQVEITSCGLNGGPLMASGCYPAAIACHLTDFTTMAKIDYSDPCLTEQVKITQGQGNQFITKIKDGTTIGYKYFDFQDVTQIQIELCGSWKGSIMISTDEAGKDQIGKWDGIWASEWFRIISIPVKEINGKTALYFYFTGKGTLDFKSFAFI